jgi:hypothetical protein
MSKNANNFSIHLDQVQTLPKGTDHTLLVLFSSLQLLVARETKERYSHRHAHIKTDTAGLFLYLTARGLGP